MTTHGYHAQAHTALAAEQRPFTAGEETPASRVSERLLAFEKEQSLLADQTNCLVRRPSEF